MYWQTTADEQAALEEFIKELTIRSANGMIRFYQKIQTPYQLDYAEWCDTLIDIFFFRHHENKQK